MVENNLRSQVREAYAEAEDIRKRTHYADRAKEAIDATRKLIGDQSFEGGIAIALSHILIELGIMKEKLENIEKKLEEYQKEAE